MKVTVEITCDTIRELKAHLGCLIEQVDTERMREGLTDEDEFDPERYSELDLDDNNCYGTHMTTIENE